MKGSRLTCLTKIDFLLWIFLQTLEENGLDFNVKFKTMEAFNPILLIQTNEIDLFRRSIMKNTTGDCADHMINREWEKYRTKKGYLTKLRGTCSINFLVGFGN